MERSWPAHRIVDDVSQGSERVHLLATKIEVMITRLQHHQTRFQDLRPFITGSFTLFYFLLTNSNNISTMADDDDLNPHEWEKPAWAKEGPKLKSTGKGTKKKLKLDEMGRFGCVLVCGRISMQNQGTVA